VCKVLGESSPAPAVGLRAPMLTISLWSHASGWMTSLKAAPPNHTLHASYLARAPRSTDLQEAPRTYPISGRTLSPGSFPSRLT
jgi:hypothetical protein